MGVATVVRVGNGSLKGEWSGCEDYGEDGKKGENYDAEGYISLGFALTTTPIGI